ncbi:hypothetical protein FZI32_21485 [Cronobacter sakazakii]|nr:hypothetical protein FZH93_23010 [Cronobacter sakazakii]KAB0919288.1 hypothetical protein FZI09_22210 [Cronobacter sakazakii]KAB0948259.1 hypothetical protein FZH91_21255 [Cronobacter sakazakii]KAB0982647.1 hypothetical protein FZI20_16400 [Cronobacter sakazakii]KAB0984680.1 hypothetical protein FZI30_19620 [Cronobacter sakazakii]
MSMLQKFLSSSHEIRKKVETDLRTPPHRADARKHKICHSVSCLLIHMLCYALFRDAARSRRNRHGVKIMNVVHFRKTLNKKKIGSCRNGLPVIYRRVYMSAYYQPDNYD